MPTAKKETTPSRPFDPKRDAKPEFRGPHGGTADRDMNKRRFPDIVKSGEIERLTATKTAQKLKLAEQYRMFQQGDAARRLELQKQHGGRKDFYRGRVSPAYQHHAFKHHYRGPAFFAGVCWYPTWNSWVKWSWHYHCNPYWDPRPVWCRPILYHPSPLWVYWEIPVWTPLPATVCGTWVDLKPVVLPPAACDLQLVAVRFVDPGHPEDNTGPRYRIWFRNNSEEPLTQPFNVVLLANNDNDQKPDASLPQAGVRVTAIEANDIQSVDVRLPADVYSMGRDAKGDPVPFSMLHVLIDAHQEVAETTKLNNGTKLQTLDILPVDPAAFELEPAAAKPGGVVTLAGEGLGPQPGRVFIQVNGQELDAEILGWYDLGVRWTLPKLAVNAPVDAEVVVVRGDGAATNPLRLTIVPD